jgi:hypothetical protein
MRGDPREEVPRKAVCRACWIVNAVPRLGQNDVRAAGGGFVKTRKASCLKFFCGAKGRMILHVIDWRCHLFLQAADVLR